MAQAQLLFINGTSSTGKTTLARKLQALWPTPMIYLGLDSWITTVLAEKYWEQAVNLDQIKDDLSVKQGTHFLLPNTVDNLTPWPKIASGSVSDQAVAILHDTALAFLNKGSSVVLDGVFLSPTWRDDFLLKTAHCSRCLIQMIAPDTVLKARERQRGDRMKDVFRSLNLIIHQGLDYDLSLDSGILSEQQCVEKTLSWLKAHQRV